MKQNTRKASGPDGVSTHALRSRAAQLAPVFTNIFNCYVRQHVVPRCFKSSIIVPVPKKAKAVQLNDYWPVALTSVVIKVFERLVPTYLKDCTGHLRDPFQFAYQNNRSVENAVALSLHQSLWHLENSGSDVKMLFLDFSSAFNTILFCTCSLINCCTSTSIFLFATGS